MADLILDARTRTVTGRHVHALRREGSVPAVLYGHNLESVAISTDAKQLARVWKKAGRTHLVDLKVDDGNARKVLFRAFQSDPRTGNPIHADFFAVNLREKLITDIPVVIVGESEIVTSAQGQVQQVVTHIRVECLPGNIPSQLTADISGLDHIDASMTLGEVPLPDGVTLVHADVEEVVVKIVAVRAAPSDADDAAAASGDEAPVSEADAGSEGGESA